MNKTKKLFSDDAYLTECTATVLAVNQRNGIILDQTVFYPTGGGQSGDIGTLENDGKTVQIATTITDRDSGELIHVAADGEDLFSVGDTVTATIDWQKRYQHMKMHSALHLLCAVVPCGVTGGKIGDTKSRLDFDIGESNLDKEQITNELTKLVEQNQAEDGIRDVKR